ncbi:type-1 angiotensin II receptor-associated protein-like [Glandiceps talaboti]
MGCRVPLWPCVLLHTWLSVAGFQASLGFGTYQNGPWITNSYAWMNFTIVAFGAWTVGQRNIKENCLILIVSLFLGFIFDIVFLALYEKGFDCVDNNTACGRGWSEFLWSFIMAVLNAICKIMTLIIAICEFMYRNGSGPNVKASVTVA